jgi:hypothetical protein
LELQDAFAQTIYAQLKEEAIVFDSVVLGADARGSAYSITKDGRVYWYWQVSTPSGIRKMLVGRDSEETRATIARMRSQKRERADLLDGLKRASAAFLAAGGMRNEPSHFRVMDKLALAGLFRKGLVLVGSHGFVSIGNALGVRWERQVKTTDMDLARSKSIAVAVPDDSNETLSVPEVAKSVDSSFFLVPELDVRQASSSLMSRKTKVKIDFLTARRSGDKPGTRYFPDIDIAATPLRFMDYLLSGQNFKGLIVGNYAIPVTLPDPARFAIHKLIIAQERNLNRDIKAIKDIQQANEVLDALLALGKETGIRDAVAAAGNLRGAFANINKSIDAPRGLSDEVKAFVKPLAARRNKRKRLAPDRKS